MRVKIDLPKLVWNVLALSMAWLMWGWKGFLFTLGLILSNGGK